MTEHKSPEEILEEMISHQNLSIDVYPFTTVQVKVAMYRYYNQFQVSDDEIEQEARKRVGRMSGNEHNVFLSAAKWMRDKIFNP